MASRFHPSGKQFTITAGRQRAVAVEVGGALREYRVGSRHLVDGYAADEMCVGARGQTLIPWPNRIEDGSYSFASEQQQLPLTEVDKHNAIHGLVRWVPWQLASRGEHKVRLACRLLPSPGYPHALDLTVEYALRKDGLTVTTTAKNIGSRLAPYATGAHPYLTAGTDRIDDAFAVVPGGKCMPTDERGIPTETIDVEGSKYDFRQRRQLEDVQIDVAYTELARDADGKARVRLTQRDGTGAALWVDESYPYLEIFTGDALPVEPLRRRGLGVEPMTAPPNAFRSGQDLIRLDPGATVTSRWGIEPLTGEPGTERSRPRD
ncbi:MAG: aldose 1-epimerase family protein [Actinomycetota bacterium]|nr:aldose 1-epimerase family protein [Actinomycetota bacterium]